MTDDGDFEHAFTADHDPDVPWFAQAAQGLLTPPEGVEAQKAARRG
jgi:hypothetical protein